MKLYLLKSIAYELRDISRALQNEQGTQDGGEGSGNWGHAGRPGKVGGSGESGFMKHLDMLAKDPKAKKEHSVANYITEDGKLTPERKKLHRSISKKILDVDTKTDSPAIYFMGGGSASGKSSAIKEGMFGDIPSGEKNSKGQYVGGIYIDADEIKKEIPEFDERRRSKDRNISAKAAGYVHEESSAMVKYLTERAYKLSSDTVIDGTLAGNINKVRRKIQAAKATGRPVIGNFVTVDIDEALERNYKRYLRGLERGDARMPNPYIVVQTHKEVTTNFEGCVDLFDGMALVDNNGPEGSSKKIAVAENGKLKILDKKAYQAFKNKENVDLDKAVENFYKRHPDAPKFSKEQY